MGFCQGEEQTGTRKALGPLKDLTTNPIKDLGEYAGAHLQPAVSDSSFWLQC